MDGGVNNLAYGERFGETFPKEEFQARLARVREGMAEKGLDTLLQFSPASLFYLTGYNTAGFNNWQCLVVPISGNPVLVLRLLERPIALATAWTDSIETYQDHEEPEAAVARTLSDLGLSNASLGAEQTSPFLTVGSYNKLNGMVGGRLSDGTGIVESVRLIKSDLELDYFRRAARSTEAGMQAAVDAIAVGKTENDVAAASYRAMTDTGGEFFCNSPIVTAGYKSGLAHTTYHRRTLERGDPVAIEIGATYNRYTSPLFRTAAVGEATPDLRRMYEACKESMEAAIEAIKPGARSRDVQEACQKVIDARGFEAHFRKRVGYGLGVGYPPTWGEGHIIDLKHHDERELRAGMVFHLVPALRENGEYGVGTSETVAVTESGHEVITDFSRELFIRG